MNRTINHATQGRTSVGPSVIVTLDALGTLYGFNAPVARQYLSIARRCGIRADIKEDDLKQAFRSCFNSHALQYPNYGKDRLKSPEEWWINLVNKTFGRVVDAEAIPSSLGSSLYDHFSSGDAYTLFADVKPFLEKIHDLREEFSSSGSRLTVGVITNSDPRVRRILDNLTLTFRRDTGDETHEVIGAEPVLPSCVNQGEQKDFDFITTSYEAGAEKPDAPIFSKASAQASHIMLGELKSATSVTLDAPSTLEKERWLHIGDDVAKDVEAAKEYGIKALLIDRDGLHECMNDRIASLEDSISVIRAMRDPNSG